MPPPPPPPPPAPSPLPFAAGYGAASYAAMLAGARRTPADLHAFVELHIEQVRALELVCVLLCGV